MAAEGIGALGIAWEQFAFQALNFLVLLGILRVFAYPAIVRALEGRKQKIDEQLKNAAELERRITLAHLESTSIIDASHQKAHAVIADASARADMIVTDAFAKAKQETHTMIQAAHRRIEQEVDQARQHLRAETAMLVVSATGKVLNEKMTHEKDLEIIERALS